MALASAHWPLPPRSKSGVYTADEAKKVWLSLEKTPAYVEAISELRDVSNTAAALSKKDNRVSKMFSRYWTGSDWNPQWQNDHRLRDLYEVKYPYNETPITAEYLKNEGIKKIENLHTLVSSYRALLDPFLFNPSTTLDQAIAYFQEKTNEGLYMNTDTVGRYLKEYHQFSLPPDYEAREKYDGKTAPDLYDLIRGTRTLQELNQWMRFLGRSTCKFPAECFT
ncbi:hypothetical protein EBZ37_07170 [bacterium]|nr:hypothetical protein [bacterium]